MNEEMLQKKLLNFLEVQIKPNRKITGRFPKKSHTVNLFETSGSPESFEYFLGCIFWE
jgi:hypothetical protein